jgi:uncharacterized protein (DUF58 family)
MRWSSSSSRSRSSEAASGPEDEALLPPALLNALRGLEIVSPSRRRRLGEGAHPALRHGREEEFFQHRPYVRGDDLRSVDWRASARTGHPLVMQRHAPSRRPLTVLLDTSDSMAFPERASKLRMAKVLAAALAFLALRRGDSVELSRLEGGQFEKMARLWPARRSLHAISNALTAFRPTGQGDLAGALAAAGTSAPRRHGLVVVLSDLYGDEAGFLAAVASIRRVAEVVVVQILAGSEVEMPAGTAALQELESGSVASLDGASARDYGARVAAWRERLGAGVRSAGADWVEADPAEPAIDVLTRWLRPVS